MPKYIFLDLVLFATKLIERSHVTVTEIKANDVINSLWSYLATARIVYY